MVPSFDPIQFLIGCALGLVALALVTLRWLRVAQREHYIAPWVTVIHGLWLRVHGLNLALYIVALVLFEAAVVGAVLEGVAVLNGSPPPEIDLRWAALGSIALCGLLPIGLGVRGRTGALVWTPRLKRLLGVWLVVVLGGIAAFIPLLGVAGIPMLLLFAPMGMDLALLILKPVEKRLSRRFLLSARKRLKQVGPKVVAITGSYGKTSTKGYVAQLLGGAFSVVASPASFNNLMGLSRAVNERVVPGTEVFIAEMGVYGRGEIRELSESFPPDIAAITTIGEAHLARMGSREVIFQAKAEITEKAATVVLPIDEPMLYGLAEQCRAQGKRVITVSTDPAIEADVVVADGTVSVQVGGPFGGQAKQTAPVTISNVGHAVNLAVAVGIATALEVPLSQLAPRLAQLPDAPHRAEVQHVAVPRPDGSSGEVTIIDDTYNSNPVGAARAVAGAAELAAARQGALVVVTPGMVELGSVQRDRNRAFAAQVAAAGGILFAIGRTNRAALVDGAPGARLFTRRGQAVAAALDQAGDRGVILYENDLPDHYP